MVKELPFEVWENKMREIFLFDRNNILSHNSKEMLIPHNDQNESESENAQKYLWQTICRSRNHQR